MAGFIGSKASVTLVDGYNQAEADAEFVAKAGDTMTGDLDVDGTVSATSFSGDGSGLTGVGGSTNFGAVGTYFAGFLEVSAGASGGYNAGATVSGSLLKYSLFSVDNPNDSSYVFESVINTSNGFVSAGLSGTWRMMSGPLKWRDTGKHMSSLFVRIS